MPDRSGASAQMPSGSLRKTLYPLGLIILVRTWLAKRSDSFAPTTVESRRVSVILEAVKKVSEGISGHVLVLWRVIFPR